MFSASAASGAERVGRSSLRTAAVLNVAPQSWSVVMRGAFDDLSPWQPLPRAAAA